MAPKASPFTPRAIAHVELAGPLPALPGSTRRERQYRTAMVLARVHGHPIGVVTVSLPEDELPPSELAQAIWSTLSTEIKIHMVNDGLAPPDELGPSGLSRAPSPPCWAGEPSPPPKISVIIATKDRPIELEMCLKALLQLDYSNFEVLVVDNGAPSQTTAGMIERLFADDPRVRYLHEDRAGTSRARNRGVLASTGEIVAFTDDDVVIDGNWLRAIARRFEVEPEVDCVTGLVMPAAFDTRPQQWFEEYGGFNKGYEARTFRRKREPGYTLLYPYTAGAFGSGNNAAFRRRALPENGGFDTNLGPGSPARAGEDLDLFLSVIMNGGAIAYEPAAIISHFHRSDYEGLRRQLFNYGLGLTAIFAKWALRRPVHALEILRRFPLGVWMVLSPKSPKNRNKSTGYPADLGRQEIKGMLLGPLAYAYSVITSRKRQ